jgi:SAM-dependent methyltransferase
MTNPSSIRGKSVLELGAGCGLTGLTAARIIQQPNKTDDSMGRVILTDFNPTVLQNLVHNITLNHVQECCTVKGLDIYDQSSSGRGWVDMDASHQDPVDVVLVTDMICQPDDAVAAANTLYASLKPGGRAYSVCPRGVHRFGVDRFMAECQRVGLVVHVTNVQDMYHGALSSNNADLDKTAGYWEGMNHDFFSIDKLASKLPTEQS